MVLIIAEAENHNGSISNAKELVNAKKNVGQILLNFSLISEDLVIPSAKKANYQIKYLNR